MRAGLLDRRVRIDQKSVARNSDFGSEVVTWTPLATVWAQVIEQPENGPSGGERVQQNLRTYARRSTLRIRYRNDLNTDMRVVLLDRSSRALRIVGMTEAMRRQVLELTCEDYSA